MNKKQKILCLSLVLLLLVLIWLVWDNTVVELNQFTIENRKLPEAFGGYRIAHISDFHNSQKGEKVLKRLSEAEPDMIVITGDLIDSRNTKIDVALNFVEAAIKIAPCYYVTGNHESRIAEYVQLREGLTEMGVAVLEDSDIKISHADATVTLIGAHDPAFSTSYLFGDSNTVMDEKLQRIIPNQDSYSILLSHRPEFFEAYVDSGVDLVFSGHVHGGQFRLPIVGGLFAPSQGLFPEYDAGLYEKNGTTMVVSRGIGNSLFPIRFNNPSEVILVELKGGYETKVILLST